MNLLTPVAALLALLPRFHGAAQEGPEPPPSPFGAPAGAERPDAAPGRVVLSDGKELRGKLYLTRDQDLEVFVNERSEWRRLKLRDLARVAFSVESEETVREWRWKEAGSDEKVETGRTRVDRKYSCRATLKDGTVLEGHVRGTVIYVRDGKEERKLFLYWNQPGGFEQKPEDLVYVKEVVFGEAAGEPEKSSLKIIVTPKELPLFEEEEAAQPEKKPDGRRAPEQPAPAPGAGSNRP